MSGFLVTRAAVIGLLLLATACSSDTGGPPATRGTTSASSASDAESASTRAGSTSSASASTTAIPQTTPAAATTEVEPAVEPMLEELIDRHDAAVAAVLADPSVAASEDNPLVQAYLALFVPASTFPSKVIETWSAEAEAGHFYRAGSRGELTESTVVSVTPSATPDEVTFEICTMNSVEITDAAGNLLSSEGGLGAATVVAARVDGAWLLRDLTQAPADRCPELGTG